MLSFIMNITPLGTLETPSAQVFVCYKHSDAHARGIIDGVAEALGKAHQLRYDQAESADLSWAEQLTADLRSADTVVVVLSQQSVASEMVEAELALVRSRASAEAPEPRVLALRMPSVAALPYPLRRYVERAREIVFSGNIQQLSADLVRLFEEEARSEVPPNTAAPGRAATAEARPRQPPQPLPWAEPEPADAAAQAPGLYLERAADKLALGEIQKQGTTITIKGPRQVGKSSLLARLNQAARAAGKKVVALDFQLFDRQALGDAASFYRAFCAQVSQALGLPAQLDSYWGEAGDSFNCTRYFERYLLPRLDKPLVLALDNVDRIHHETLRSDFLAMLRSWHNNRALKPIWIQCDLVLVTATEPHQLIDSPYQSPFNVGLIIALEDFTPEQVSELNTRHGSPFDRVQERALFALLGGHPFLIRRALYLVVSGRHTPAELLAAAQDDRGPFGDHLRHHVFKLHHQPEYVPELLQIIRQGVCSSEHSYDQLHSAGLVRREDRRALPRCSLYASYFQHHLP